MNRHLMLALLCVATLSGCQGTSTEGVHAELLAVGRNGVAPAGVTAADGSPVQAPASEQDGIVYRDADGMKVELEFAALNLQVVSVNPCSSVATLLQRAVDFVLPSAVAHGSAVGVHSGGVVLLEGPADLGEVELTPGRYCSVTVAIIPGTEPMPDYAALAAAASPPLALKDVTMTDLSGIGAGVSACFYYPSQGADRQAAYDQTGHTCLANLRLVTEPVTLEFAFDPITLDASTRHLGVTLSVRYDRWFDGIAMDLPGEALGAGGQVRRFSTENPNPLRPFPDKDVVPGSNPKDQCSATPSCTAEFQGFVDALVGNITNPDNFELTVDLN